MRHDEFPPVKDHDVEVQNKGVNTLDLSEGVQKSLRKKQEKTLSDATGVPYPVPLPHPSKEEKNVTAARYFISDS